MKRRSFLTGLSASAAVLAGARANATMAATGAVLEPAMSTIRRDNCSFVAGAQNDLMLDLESGRTAETRIVVRCPLCGEAVAIDAANLA